MEAAKLSEVSMKQHSPFTGTSTALSTQLARASQHNQQHQQGRSRHPRAASKAHLHLHTAKPRQHNATRENNKLPTHTSTRSVGNANQPLANPSQAPNRGKRAPHASRGPSPWRRRAEPRKPQQRPKQEVARRRKTGRGEVIEGEGR